MENTKEQDKKFCPLSFSGDVYGDCLKEDCAWFDGMKKACCVKGLAELRQTLHVVRDDEQSNYRL